VPAQPRTSTRSPIWANGTLYWRPSNATRPSIPTRRTPTSSNGSGRISGSGVNPTRLAAQLLAIVTPVAEQISCSALADSCVAASQIRGRGLRSKATLTPSTGLIEDSDYLTLSQTKVITLILPSPGKGCGLVV
jgi:hypothetical protein